MNALAEMILMSMLNLIPPGMSKYSRVPVDYCDNQCQKTYICENKTDFRCQPPKFSRALYEEKVKNLTNKGISLNEAEKLAKPLSFTRAETSEEALARYIVIAEAISKVSEQQVKETWSWDQRTLAYMLLTITSYESGFRADVHGGAKRGDCDWVYSDGRRARPGAKGSSPIPGTCKSVCLGQINFMKSRTILGYTKSELVGIDLASTKRCLTVVAKKLAGARNYCSKSKYNWIGATFSAYGSGIGCNVLHLHGRKKRFELTFNSWRRLDEKTSEFILNPITNKIYKELISSNKQIRWHEPASLIKNATSRDTSKAIKYSALQ